ncbi:beta-phosphoglucomutase family hydrolase [Dichotomicrobium thermohalophilum]|uniref:HAD superfamily hydrolase (TIGR01509 family)/beta-phosphoglucomutase family hydrolase n=1 Tax=Dichotomicrobium thermohalophilum TaxID=933063 RepID=A0A397Q4F6_9HYPH|nr:beta-phosphoglucomutase family hydrolase [Dichotomicrobium thermohalophilum]RIA56012.1 HAD superfamily hydrolase (TIGR01509 family)/beta-phosphoglucomutase family hydrolase [Dichotomicrobium thermohalophilum]
MPATETIAISADHFDAAIFDLDGVITDTARTHASAWKRLFDAFLRQRQGPDFQPFQIERDYYGYVDGRPRYEGVQSFLDSRGITLPCGDPSDAPGMDTICALGNAKNAHFREAVASEGVKVFEDAPALIRKLRAAGIKVGMVTASRNGALIVEAAGLENLFDARVDGVDIAESNLQGKPAPDSFVECARRLEAAPRRSIVFEDALVGVEAGRRGGFGLVIGVDRQEAGHALMRHGADVVVSDFGRIVVDAPANPDRDRHQWSLVCDGFAPEQEGLREALCTLGNGYFATRGAAQEASADDVHYPGTYLAGGYDRLKTHIAGEVIENEDLVNFPNWLPLNFRPEDGDWLELTKANILDYRLELNLRHGLLLRTLRIEDAQGRRTRIESRRFVHMTARHYAGIKTIITAENWSGPVQLRSALDGRVTNSGVARYGDLRGDHLEPTGQGNGEETPIWLRVRTKQSRIEMAQAARTTVYRNGTAIDCTRTLTSEAGHVAEDLNFALQEGRPVSVEKIVALYTSRDTAISEAALEACNAVERAPRFPDLERSHADAWDRLWQRAEIAIRDGGIDHPTKLLRLHAFHLLQVMSPNTVEFDAGVPARGLHGEAYRGHVFWDELFIFPFFNIRFPEIARALIDYRHRRLDAARRLARQAGFKGAMYPWQSGSNGREESQRLHLNPKSGRWIPDNTHLQRHVSAAIAYNVWQHYQATSDIQFLRRCGAEMLLEIGRFWASLTQWNPSRERYEIRGVMGPDEYHDGYPDAETPGIDNNAYTNIMAVWCLSTAQECLDLLPPGWRQEIREDIALTDDELDHWADIKHKMFVPFHDDGLISQFEGYETLKEFDWEGYREKYDTIERLDRILEAEGDTPNRYKLSKQADVLMLFYLFSAEQLTALLHQLGYDFDPASIPRNVEYYLRRTAHGSSLSRVVHSWVLARADRERSWRLFHEALRNDVAYRENSTTHEGIHLGAMAATVDIIQRCYAGMELRHGRLWLHPCLPDELNELSFTMVYQNNELDVHIGRDAIRLHAAHYAKEPAEVFINGEPCTIRPGKTLERPLS